MYKSSCRPSNTYTVTSFIKTEKQIVVPSQDKFITGASAPGSTTMVLGSPDKKEKPLFVDNLDRRFNFEFSNIL